MAMTFDYQLPAPGFAIKPFTEMTQEEAERHFEWFTGIAKNRTELLLNAIVVIGGNAPIPDFTPDSLFRVWTWVSGHLERKTETKLTPGSLALVLDTGFYLAEVFFRQYPGRLRWKLWRRKTGPHNKPVIEGFKVPLVPSDVVKACAWDVLKAGPQDNLLHRKYLVWAKDLERPN
jgi:hypothetical protein